MSEEADSTRSRLGSTTERMLSFLSELKADFGISMSESVRQAVSLFFIAKQEERKGHRLVFVDKSGRVATRILFQQQQALVPDADEQPSDEEETQYDRDMADYDRNPALTAEQRNSWTRA